MNKEIFLSELERLLYEIPREEREEAMDFYRSYFEDAGVENETVVLEELESPQKIAESIKEGLNNTGDMSSCLKNPLQVRQNQSQSKTDSDGRQTTTDGAQRTQNDTQHASFGSASYRRYDQYEKKDNDKKTSSGMDKRTKLILLIILAVFTIPVWGTIISGIFGIVGVTIAVVIVLGVFSVGGVIGGVTCTIMAIVRLCTLSLVKGLVMLGVGMLLIATSGISIVLLLLLCGRFLPWAVNQVIQLVRRLLTWGRSMA